MPKVHPQKLRAASERPGPGRAHLDKQSLARQLIDMFDQLSPQLKAAGRFVLDHPQDVALWSMRRLAREANLPPATMTRLAQQLGFARFDDLKKLHAEDIRQYAAGYRTKAIQIADTKRGGDAAALAVDVLSGISRQVDALAAPEAVHSLVQCASLLGAARTIYCLGQRSSFPPAYAFQYIHSLAGGSSVLLDAPGGTGFDALRRAKVDDALLAISVLPYTRTTIDQAEFASRRGIPVICITDSDVSPLALIARHIVKVGTKSRSFFQTMVAVSAASETLATLTAMASRKRVLDGLKSSEEYFTHFNIYWTPSTGRDAKSAPPHRAGASTVPPSQPGGSPRLRKPPRE
jgi:DNA-binding MurR/RpiR family transcriptional regulator